MTIAHNAKSAILDGKIHWRCIEAIIKRVILQNIAFFLRLLRRRVVVVVVIIVIVIFSQRDLALRFGTHLDPFTGKFVSNCS